MNKHDVETLFYIAVGGLLLGAGGVAVYDLTRGLRNNNPGNIRRSSELWQGLAPTQTDSEFFQFASPQYGIRALARILTNYQELYGFSTVREIISRYAPSSENDTASYIAAVAAKLGVTPDAQINVRAALPALIPTIIQHENGINPYSDSLINYSIGLAA